MPNYYGIQAGLPANLATQLGGIMVSQNSNGSSSYRPGGGGSSSGGRVPDRYSPSFGGLSSYQPTQQRLAPTSMMATPTMSFQNPGDAQKVAQLWSDYQQHNIPNGIGTELGTRANLGYNPSPSASQGYGSYPSVSPTPTSPQFVGSPGATGYGQWGQGIPDVNVGGTNLTPNPFLALSQLWKRSAFEGNTGVGRIASNSLVPSKIFM
jgi:hypothetical protein